MKSRPALIIVPLVILAVALATGSVLMLRLFSLAVLVLLLSYLWVRLGVRGISSQVKKSAERCQVGDRFGEEITVFSSSRIPKLLIKAEENTNLPGYHNVAIFNLSPKGSYCWQTEYYCQRRGHYRLGSLMVTVADPFGFFSRQRDLRQSQNIIVYVREYASGDTLNRIHWRSTSHTGKLMVKEFDADRSNAASKNVWVVLDMYQAVQAGAGDDSTEEYGVTIAASLLKKYVDSGRRVGLIASGGQPYLFPLETGSQHLSDMLEALALIKATGEVPVEQLISREIGRFTINSVVIVITPAANEQLVASLRQVRSRGAPVIIVSLDSASFGGRATGSLVSGSFQVYVIRHGEELNRALDSRRLIPQVR
ncbi:MAG: DUF58 domain-containing protein [Chloroflexi bacterium]|nr:DUF58 domain-containing protein [Chloroflexota bacterium]